jgi:hypothetical protein
MERITVKATYVVADGASQSTGSVEFVARVKDSSKGYNLSGRAKQAVARRNKVKHSAVTITGLSSW